MSFTGSDLVVRALQAEGIDTAFAIAGDHTLHLMDRMHHAGFRFVDTRHEQAAVDMANAWSRITGSPGVSMFTTPGHANAIPGLTFAHHTDAPVINISGSAEQDRLGQGAPQEIDQVGMASPVTRGAWFVSDPRRIPELLAKAFRTALTGRRGPVHLTIPVDVQQAEIDEADIPAYRPEEYRPTDHPAASPGAVQSALELLTAARRPMVIAGNGAYTVDGTDLKRVIERLRLPLFTEEAARGVVSDDHDLCFGYADVRVSDAAKLVREADVVMLLGKKLDFSLSYGGPPTFGPNVKLIQVEPSAELIGLSRGVDLPVNADVGSFVAQAADLAEERTGWEHPMLSELRSVQEAQEKALEGRAAASPPLRSMNVHKALRSVIDDDTCLVFEGSDFGFYGAAYHPSTKPGRWFTNGTLGMLGWGIPFGIGARVALPESRVVVCAGDGAFGFNGMELDTAVRHGLPVVVVVGNDAVWGIDYHQQVQLFGAKVATELFPTRYDKVAEALGAHGEYVEEEAQLAPALQRAFSSGKPAVVNVRTRPDPSTLTEYIIEQKSP